MELMFSLIQKFDYPSTSLMNEATPSAMKKVALYHCIQYFPSREGHPLSGQISNTHALR
jgi:hypothetical protein